MSNCKVEICGVNTATLPILSEAEKETLWDKIKAGDKKARETYITGNLRLVLSIVRRFMGQNENMDDLFQIGCIGLMKSVDNFDPVPPMIPIVSPEWMDRLMSSRTGVGEVSE